MSEYDARLVRMDATIALLEHLQWFANLPRHYKLIVKAQRVRKHLDDTVSRYEGTVRDGTNTWEQARKKWMREALTNNGMTAETFRKGELMDDARDYRLMCEVHNLPLCCPHFVKDKRCF